MLSSRNQTGLSRHQITRCEAAWEDIGGNKCCRLDVSEATNHGSQTRFIESPDPSRNNTVYLGADVVPGAGITARSRMSEMACLAHELAHAERFALGYKRTEAQKLIDEAETSLRASVMPPLSPRDRQDLLEDGLNPIYRTSGESQLLQAQVSLSSLLVKFASNSVGGK